jgi:nucleotide-binding universal stress UspA family protein
VGTVTVCLDGSPECAAVARWAAREAMRRGARLIVLHVVPQRPGRTTFVTPTDPRPRPAGKRWSPYPVAEALQAAYPALSVTASEVTGRTVPALLTAAAETDLLVLGSRDTGAVGSLLPGSVAREVTRRSPAPVVLVRTGERETDEHQPDPDGNAATTTPYREVVVGVDVRHPYGPVLDFAFDAASRRAAPLRVVHGGGKAPPSPADRHGPDSPFDGMDEATDDSRKALTRTLARWAPKFPHTDVIPEAVVGDTGKHLVDVAAKASLLVIGRDDRTAEVGPVAGSVGRTVLRDAPAAVAVVPHR